MCNSQLKAALLIFQGKYSCKGVRCRLKVQLHDDAACSRAKVRRQLSSKGCIAGCQRLLSLMSSCAGARSAFSLRVHCSSGDSGGLALLNIHQDFGFPDVPLRPAAHLDFLDHAELVFGSSITN